MGRADDAAGRADCVALKFLKALVLWRSPHQTSKPYIKLVGFRPVRFPDRVVCDNPTLRALLEFQKELDVFEGVVHAGLHKCISFHFAQSKKHQLKIKLSMDSCEVP